MKTLRSDSRSIILMAIVVLVAIIPFFAEGYDDLWTCALCRTNRTDYVYVGHCWGTTCSESVCTQWYRDHIEAEHSHVWIHSSASALKNLYGQRVGTIDRDPIGRMLWRLSPEDQIEIYRHVGSPEDGKRLIFALVEPDSRSGDKDVALFHSLNEWQDSEYANSLRPSIPE